MPVWLRWVGFTVIALAVVAGAAYWWYFLESHVPDGNFALDIGEIRSLANSIQAEKPIEVHVEHVAGGQFPLAFGIAGGAWTAADMPFQAFQVVYNGRGALIIDSTLDRKTADTNQAKNFDDAAFGRVLAGMTAAEHIVVTHEHFDHLGGLASAANIKDLMAKAVLTKEQVESNAPVAAHIPADALIGYTPLSYEGYHALAPGVVLIKSPGHTPGSQMVFVQLGDGTEYLFLGDVAWKMANVDLVRERPRAVTDFFLAEDRNKVALQLAAIKALKDANPAIHIVPGHDRGVLDAAISEGWLKKGFN